MPKKIQRRQVAKKKTLRKKSRTLKKYIIARKRTRGQAEEVQKNSAQKIRVAVLESIDNLSSPISNQKESVEPIKQEMTQKGRAVEAESFNVHQSRELDLNKFLASDKYYLNINDSGVNGAGLSRKEYFSDKPQSDNWLDSIKLNPAPSQIRINLKTRRETFVDVLASLPSDIVFFYRWLFKSLGNEYKFSINLKSKFNLFLEIIIWSLETLGRAPFIVMTKFFLISLFFLNIFEKFCSLIIARILESIILSWRDFYYILRRIYCNLFWIFKSGAREIIDLPGRLVSSLKPHPPSGWTQAVASFVVACFVLVLPLRAYVYLLNLRNTQGLVLGAAASAYEHLQNAQRATSALVFSEASEEFEKANKGFTSAKSELDQLNFLISNIIKITPKGASAQKLLACGQAIAEAGEYFSRGLDFLIPLDESSVLAAAEPENGLPQFNIEDRGLEFLRKNVNLALPKIIFAQKNIEQIDIASLPEANQENFTKTREKILRLEKMMKRLLSFTDIASELLGAEARKRYLFIFQNDSEIRPTGGFIGSFALLDIYKSQIKNLEIPGGGPYDLKGGLLKRVKPPYPLQVLNSQWQMQDANWFPDFPTSAKKIIWFYENSGGPSVDGVVAINSSLIPKLLEISGPIEMPEYGKVIDKNNFQLEAQKAVEIEYDRFKNQPKQFIADLAPRLLEKVFQLKAQDLIRVLSIFDAALQERSLLFYFTDPEIQAKNKAQNWAGEIKSLNFGEDFLMLVNTNINGGKTDEVINQKISHKSTIAKDGVIVDEVEITRTHNGLIGDLFTGKKNIDYLRIYAPKGSVLVGAAGFEPLGPGHFRIPDPDLNEDQDLLNIEGEPMVDEITGTRITNEFGKTVFGNWAMLEPGETKVFKFRYRLPFKFEPGKEEGIIDQLISKITPAAAAQVYTLYLQKQPGSKNDIFESTIVFPEGLDAAWWHPADESFGKYKNAIKFRSQVDSDKYYGVVLKH